MTVDTDEGLTILRRESNGFTRLVDLPDEIFAWKTYTQHFEQILGLVTEEEFLRAFPI